MRRIADGDASAVRELYVRFAPGMVRVAAGMLQSRADAEDVVQWAVTRLWRQAAEFSAKRGTLRAWSATMVRRKAIDLLRSRGIQRRANDLIRADIPGLAPAPARDSLLRQENHAGVRAALDTLVAGEKSAISLSYFSGLTHEEIARRLQTPVGTVKARIRRGVRKMRTTLLHLDGEGAARP